MMGNKEDDGQQCRLWMTTRTKDDNEDNEKGWRTMEDDEKRSHLTKLMHNNLTRRMTGNRQQGGQITTSRRADNKEENRQ